ncbi:MAG TPA: DUF2306 domain-containing protein [Caulobacteraceae bacterium]|nr:DUF2306 domain-containing protein [Caulobacteraceae bacterium]
MDLAQPLSPKRSRAGAVIPPALLVLLSLGIVGYALVTATFSKFPPPVAANTAGLVTLTLHASFAAVALLIGPFQFMPAMRSRHRRLHRWMGRLYCAVCLIGGVAGGALAWGTTSGPVARYGFLGLSIAWLACTALAWASAVSADFANHRRWMVRSFSLTFAAVTLRLYLPISLASGLRFEDAYPVIAWACWVPNLMFAEWWLRRTPRIRA